MKKIILKRKNRILQEEVFGAQSFVYHGSYTSPKDFIKLLASDEFAPGLGAGSAYGRGLYTVYTYRHNFHMSLFQYWNLHKYIQYIILCHMQNQHQDREQIHRLREVL